MNMVQMSSLSPFCQEEEALAEFLIYEFEKTTNFRYVPRTDRKSQISQKTDFCHSYSTL